MTMEPQAQAPPSGPATDSAEQATSRFSGDSRKQRRRDSRLWLLSLVGGLLLWEVVGRFVVTNPLFFAPLSDVLVALWQMAREGTLWNDFRVTGLEVLIGVSLAIIVGVAFGFLIGMSHDARIMFRPWLNALYSTPLAALAPIFILWFGIGMGSKVATVFVSAVFPIIINSAAGIATTDQNFVDAARSFGLKRHQVFMKVLVPSALAFIATGIRLAVGRGLVGAVVAELFGARAGLGFRVFVSQQAFQTADLLAGVLVLAVTGVVALGLVERVETSLAPWRTDVKL